MSTPRGIKLDQDELVGVDGSLEVGLGRDQDTLLLQNYKLVRYVLKLLYTNSFLKTNINIDDRVINLRRGKL